MSKLIQAIGTYGPRVEITHTVQTPKIAEYIARIVQKPQPTENRAKKGGKPTTLIPRMVFENSELWEFN